MMSFKMTYSYKKNLNNNYNCNNNKNIKNNKNNNNSNNFSKIIYKPIMIQKNKICNQVFAIVKQMKLIVK